MRSHGVLLYCLEGVHRSAAAIVVVIGYVAAASVDECVKHFTELRKIADDSKWLSCFQAVWRAFPRRALGDAVTLPHVLPAVPAHVVDLDGPRSAPA